MSLLNNILGRSTNNIISQLIGNNPQLQSLYQQAASVQDPKAQAIMMIKNGQIDRDKLEQIKKVAKQLGIKEEVFKELEIYL